MVWWVTVPPNYWACWVRSLKIGLSSLNWSTRIAFDWQPTSAQCHFGIFRPHRPAKVYSQLFEPGSLKFENDLIHSCKHVLWFSGTASMICDGLNALHVDPKCGPYRCWSHWKHGWKGTSTNNGCLHYVWSNWDKAHSHSLYCLMTWGKQKSDFFVQHS